MHDKQDRNKLKLFRYMRTRGEAPVLQVMEDLDMSRYIVLSTTQQLAIDIEMITGMTDGILIEGGSDVRFSVPATVLDWESLGLHYLMTSIRGRMVHELFHEQVTSWEEFAFDVDVSVPKMYKERAQVAEDLAREGIRISRDYKLVGNEEHIRLFKFEMLTYYNGRRDSPFPIDVQEQAREVVNEIIVPECGTLRETQLVGLRHLYAIWWSRFRQRHFVSTGFTNRFLKPTAELSDRSRRLIHLLMERMSDTPDLPFETAASEARFIILTMHTLGLFPPEQMMTDVTDSVIQYWHHFERALKESYYCLFMLRADQVDIRSVTRVLEPEILRFFVFPYVGEEDYEYMTNVADIAPEYPLAYEFSKDVMRHFSEFTGVPARDLDNFMLPDLIATVMGYPNFYRAIPAVNITIDFGGHHGIEEVMAMSLNGLPGYKIQINHVLSEYTDILVTDAPQPKDEPYTALIWRGIGTPGQMTELLQEINRVKMKKFNAWRDNNKHK